MKFHIWDPVSGQTLLNFQTIDSNISTDKSMQIDYYDQGDFTIKDLKNDDAPDFMIHTGRTKIAIAKGENLYVADRQSGAICWHTYRETNEDDFFPPRFSPDPDNTYLAAISRSGKISIWNSELGASIQEVETNDLLEFPYGISDIYRPNFSPDGTRVAATSEEQFCVVDLTSKTFKTIPFTGFVLSSPVFSPDGTQVAVIDSSTKLHIFQIEEESGSNPAS